MNVDKYISEQQELMNQRSYGQSMANEYSTDSLNVATFLHASLNNMLRIDKSEKRFRFIFEKTAKLDQDIENFHTNKSIPVLDFINSQKLMRIKIH